MMRRRRILTRQTSESFSEITETYNMMQNSIEPGASLHTMNFRSLLSTPSML